VLQDGARRPTIEANAFAVATGVVDVATSNTVNDRLPDAARTRPWPSRSPRSGSPPRSRRAASWCASDLDPALKEKIRSFFLTYGQGSGIEAERQRRVLAGLRYSRFAAADADYLDPVREMIADETLAAARASGDRATATAAERDLQRLRARREVQP
jgi:phosphonate transport system substrate-binding protein